MTMAVKPLAIAIDGGGTRCRIACDLDGVTLSVEAGSANVSTDFSAAISEIERGLKTLVDRADLSMDDLSDVPAFIGLAGMTGPEIAERLRAALPFRVMRIEDDRPAALRGALGDSDGVIAHCGTGSFFAAQHERRMRFFGGWGPVLGDEASAHAVGKAGLRLALEAVDGQYAMSPMAERFLSDHGGTAGVVRFAGNASPAILAEIAPQVTECAEQGDTLAMRVMQDAADEIAVRLPKIGWRPGLAICLTGGIAPHYASFLPPEMQADLMAPANEPLVGALSLAIELAERAGI